jgi:hypothetical protein
MITSKDVAQRVMKIKVLHSSTYEEYSIGVYGTKAFRQNVHLGAGFSLNKCVCVCVCVCV